MEEGISIKTA
jgi:hypothetical protein